MSLPRRDFLASAVLIGTALTHGAADPIHALAAESPAGPSSPSTPLTIADIIRAIETAMPLRPGTASTVDRVIIGNADAPLTGIVTTMFPTITVLREAVARGANLLVVHEPTFYSNADDVTALEHDPVYAEKRAFIEQHRLVIIRNHDRIHAADPDGVRLGIVRALGWETAFNPALPRIVDIAPMTLRDIMVRAARVLDAPNLQYIGDPELIIRRVQLSPGYNTFRSVLPLWREHRADLLIAGEIFEWEAAEYFRDAVALGHRKAVLFTGHAVSEEPGSAWMAEWLKPLAPAVPIHHVPSGEPVTRFGSTRG